MFGEGAARATELAANESAKQPQSRNTAPWHILKVLRVKSLILAGPYLQLHKTGYLIPMGIEVII